MDGKRCRRSMRPVGWLPLTSWCREAHEDVPRPGWNGADLLRAHAMLHKRRGQDAAGTETGSPPGRGGLI